MGELEEMIQISISTTLPKKSQFQVPLSDRTTYCEEHLILISYLQIARIPS